MRDSFVASDDVNRSMVTVHDVLQWVKQDNPEVRGNQDIVHAQADVVLLAAKGRLRVECFLSLAITSGVAITCLGAGNNGVEPSAFLNGAASQASFPRQRVIRTV